MKSLHLWVGALLPAVALLLLGLLALLLLQLP